MKIDSVHAEFMSGNAVSSTTSSHSIVSRDASGDIAVAGVSIAGNSGTLFSYTADDRTVYGGCNASDPWFGTSSNHDLRLITSGSERMRIDNTGNVAIGTTSPIGKLDVRGAIIAPVVAYSSNQDEPYLVAGTPDYNGDPGNTGNWNLHGIEHRIKVNNGGVPRITVDMPSGGEVFSVVNGGNIGIGTASPGTKLDVVGHPHTFIRKMAESGTSTAEYNHILGGPRPGTTIAGATHFINGSTRTLDGGSNTYTIRNDSGKLRLGNASYDTILEGDIGIGTSDPTSPLHIIGNDTDANAHFTSLVIDHNCSGGGTNTGDFNHTGILIDLDSTATGGTTGNEHRMYGIRSDTRHSGDSDLCYGVYSYTRSDHSSGTNTNLRAGDFNAVASGTGVNTNIYGINSYALKDGGSTGTTAKMFGVRGEVEVDAGTCTNAYAFQSHIDRDGGTITTGYLYYGSYSGTVTTKWGIYLTGESKNYFSGNVGIGNTTPSYELDVNGDINIASGKKFRINGTALANSATIAAETSNVASTIVLRNSNGNFSAGTITADLNGNAGTASSCSGNAGSATKLQTARTIGGVSFDGTEAIDLPGVNSEGYQNTSGRAETSNTAANANTVGGLGIASFLRTDVDTTCSKQLIVTGYNNELINDQPYFIANYQMHANYSLGEDESYWHYTSIKSTYWIRAQGLLATSDERVKTDIQTLDTGVALSKLEKIRPVSYKMKNSGEFMFGFIGQEIEKELPNVVNKDTATVVDLNTMGVFSNKQSIKYKIEDEEKDAFVYTLTLDIPIPSTFDVNLSKYIETVILAEGSTAEFFYDPEHCGKPEIGGTVMNLLSETGNVKEGVSYKIIGTRVHDFRSLDYNEIFTVTTAALKEVNEQLQAEKIKTANLTARVEELEAMVSIIKLNMTWPDA